MENDDEGLSMSDCKVPDPEPVPDSPWTLRWSFLVYLAFAALLGNVMGNLWWSCLN